MENVIYIIVLFRNQSTFIKDIIVGSKNAETKMRQNKYMQE